MKVAFLFIDGVGIKPPAADNPVNPEVCPALCRLIEHHGKPIDACLSMPGLPQSATGQATMFTGVNAPVFMGRHCEGFPGPSLRKKIEEDNDEIQDSIRQGHIAYVINTKDPGVSHTDGQQIRQIATEHNVTLFTSLDTIKVLLDVLEETTLTICTIDA